MRLTIDLPDDTFEDLKRLSGLETLQEIVELALEEFIRYRRLERLRALLGQGFDLTQEELERMREED